MPALVLKVVNAIRLVVNDFSKKIIIISKHLSLRL